MDLHDRIKVAIQILIGLKVSSNQEDVGKKLGYNNKSYFSQIINGKVSLPNDFLENLVALDSRIPKEWLINDIGFISENKLVYTNNEQMLIDTQNKYIKKLEQEIKTLKIEVENNLDYTSKKTRLKRD